MTKKIDGWTIRILGRSKHYPQWGLKAVEGVVLDDDGDEECSIVLVYALDDTKQKQILYRQTESGIDATVRTYIANIA